MRLSIITLATLLLGCVFAQVTHNARNLFEEFKLKYKRNYVNENEEERFAIFKDNLARAQVYQMQEQGTARYGITQFSDLTAEEFATHYTNAKFDIPLDSNRQWYSDDMSEPPARFDWREKGAVRPVENQGHCRSCWAFSAVGNIEGQWFLKTHKQDIFSKQQLIDCDRVDQGCNGGYMLDAYQEIMRFGGLELQSDYPYVARDQICRMDESKVVVRLNGSITLDTSEKVQANWLSTNGPLSVALNARQLQFYLDGISHPIYCKPDELNHGVLTVGYDEENGIPYWIIKNSWGRTWGEEGYFRLYRGDGTCGVNTVVTSALIN